MFYGMCNGLSMHSTRVRGDPAEDRGNAERTTALVVEAVAISIPKKTALSSATEKPCHEGRALYYYHS